MVTHSWGKYVILGIFGVSVFDSYNVDNQYLAHEETAHALFCYLAEEMIDNDIDSSPSRRTSKRTRRSAFRVLVGKGVTSHLLKIKIKTTEC